MTQHGKVTTNNYTNHTPGTYMNPQPHCIQQLRTHRKKMNPRLTHNRWSQNAIKTWNIFYRMQGKKQQKRYQFRFLSFHHRPLDSVLLGYISPHKSITPGLISILPQVHHIEPHFVYLAHVSWPHRISVDKLLVVGMEQALVPAIHDGFHAGWIGQAKYTPSNYRRVSSY